MNGPCDIFVTQHGDGPLDLPPVTEAHDVATAATYVGAARGFERRKFGKFPHEVGRVGKSMAVFEIKFQHAAL